MAATNHNTRERNEIKPGPRRRLRNKQKIFRARAWGKNRTAISEPNDKQKLKLIMNVV
jgi:hypothetical protein